MNNIMSDTQLTKPMPEETPEQEHENHNAEVVSSAELSEEPPVEEKPILTQAQLASLVESVMFVSNKPLTIKKIVSITGAEFEAVETVIMELQKQYKETERGWQLAHINNKFQLVTNPNNTAVIADYLKKDLYADLSKPSLETLTIVAYRGPVPKLEIELIRGVNCSMILRNLMMRGLVESFEDPQTKEVKYTITFDFLQYLGITDVKELPDYENLNSSEMLDRLLTGDSE